MNVVASFTAVVWKAVPLAQRGATGTKSFQAGHQGTLPYLPLVTGTAACNRQERDNAPSGSKSASGLKCCLAVVMQEPAAQRANSRAATDILPSDRLGMGTDLRAVL